jgi:6-phosphogluconate dehydrogenase
MKFAIVGLGRMGLSLGQCAVRRGHGVVAWDPDDRARAAGRDVGLKTVEALADGHSSLPSPRVVLMWVPHGTPVDANLDQLLPHLNADDVVADCGNYWEDSRRRHDALTDKGVHFLDIGTSGGISDALGWDGAAFMAGGLAEGFDVVAPLLEDLAVDDRGFDHALDHGTVIRSWLVERMGNALAKGGLGPGVRCGT